MLPATSVPDFIPSPLPNPSAFQGASRPQTTVLPDGTFPVLPD